MFYGGTPRIYDQTDHVIVGCTRCNWMSKEAPVVTVMVREPPCAVCTKPVDRYVVYAHHERSRARFWMRGRMGKGRYK